MHHDAENVHPFVYGVRMSRRLRRKGEKAKPHTSWQRALEPKPQKVPRQVKRLAYTRNQAAEALGISRTTLTRLLPYIDTIETPWGTTLIPIDELERLLAERRHPRRQRPRPRQSGRPTTLAPEVIERIRTAHTAGKSYGQIARDLNANGTPTAHGGKQWWPSTIRAILHRANAVR
jgi:Recombinase